MPCIRYRRFSSFSIPLPPFSFPPSICLLATASLRATPLWSIFYPYVSLYSRSVYLISILVWQHFFHLFFHLCRLRIKRLDFPESRPNRCGCYSTKQITTHQPLFHRLDIQVDSCEPCIGLISSIPSKHSQLSNVANVEGKSGQSRTCDSCPDHHSFLIRQNIRWKTWDGWR